MVETLFLCLIGLLGSGPLPATGFLDVKDGKAVHNEKMKPKIQLAISPWLACAGPEPIVKQMIDVPGFKSNHYTLASIYFYIYIAILDLCPSPIHPYTHIPMHPYTHFSP